MKARQSLVRDTREDEDDVTDVALAGSQARVRKPGAVAAAIIKAIGFSRAECRSLGEAQGVFVLLAGDCGHWSTAIEVNVSSAISVAIGWSQDR